MENVNVLSAKSVEKLLNSDPRPSSNILLSGYEDVTCFSNEQLEKLLDDRNFENEILSLENDVFEHAIHKLNDKKEKHIKVAFKGLKVVAPEVNRRLTTVRASRSRSRSREGSISNKLQLSAEQKCEIVLAEIEERQKVLDKMMVDEGDVNGYLKSCLREVHHRLQEIKKELFDFEREIVRNKPILNPRTGRPNYDKVIKFWQDKLALRESLTLKLRLKNDASKARLNKAYLHMRQVEETSQVLKEMDFRRLEISNNVLHGRSVQRSRDLLKLKVMASRMRTSLNSLREELQSQQRLTVKLKSGITTSQDQVARYSRESQQVSEELKELERANADLKHQLEYYKAPEVIEYAKSKSIAGVQLKQTRLWQRKLLVKEEEIKRLNQDHKGLLQLKKITMAVDPCAAKTNKI